MNGRGEREPSWAEESCVAAGYFLHLSERLVLGRLAYSWRRDEEEAVHGGRCSVMVWFCLSLIDDQCTVAGNVFLEYFII